MLGGDYNDVAGVALYEAPDDTLVNWRYQKLLYQKPRDVIRFFECPNFFKVDNCWVLITSPYKTLEYIVGDFDLETLTFTPTDEGILDPGFTTVPNFYASNILYDAQGRCILLGWARGFAPGHGWNGCLALPRILTIGPDGRPEQTPLPQLQQLREERYRLANITFDESGYLLPALQGDALEIQALLEPGEATVQVRLRRSADGQRSVDISYDGTVLNVAGTETPLTLGWKEPLKLQIFLDKTLLEVFVNGGRLAVTRVIDAPLEDTGVELVAHQGSASVIALEAWTMGAI